MRKSRISWGIVLISLGIYLFAYTSGYIGDEELGRLMDSWPVLLIVWGIDILIPERLWWLEAVLVVLLVGFAMFLSLHPQFLRAGGFV